VLTIANPVPRITYPGFYAPNLSNNFAFAIM
jgi:hypothetical protein